MLMTKISGNPNLSLCDPLPYGHDPVMTQPKSQNSNIEHDGTLSIRNLMLIRIQQKTMHKFETGD
jgi:hypothetical protein